MHVPSLIEKKRDNRELSPEEIQEMISGYTAGSIPDYQISALAMAIYFQGLTDRETAALTRAMLESGEVFSWPGDAPRVVDKHSTGGIGDKVSLVLAPLLACDDLWIPMISGRGLGITGGTLDKLESIPGFNVSVSSEQAITQLQDIGVVMMGQTPEICPADKKLYALRDVTATVPSQPLIVASIMSKKLAESLDALVLDVKFGSGAFMKTRAEAESLAARMVAVGESMDVEVSTLLTPMDEPLGNSVGNALEVTEAIATLQGNGPDDLQHLVLDLAEKVSHASRAQLETWLQDGTAMEKFRCLVAAQGGDADVLEKFDGVHPAKTITDITAPESGILRAVDADTVGRASLQLGAGRATAEDSIDYSVGFDRIAKVGTRIAKGDLLARIHAANKKDAEQAKQAVMRSFRID